MSPTNGKRLVCAVAAVVGLGLVYLALSLHRSNAINDADFLVLGAIGLEIFSTAIIGLPRGTPANQSSDVLPASRLRIPMPPVKPPRVVVLYDPKNGNPCPACKFRGPFLAIPCEAHRTEGKL